MKLPYFFYYNGMPFYFSKPIFWPKLYGKNAIKIIFMRYLSQIAFLWALVWYHSIPLVKPRRLTYLTPKKKFCPKFRKIWAWSPPMVFRFFDPCISGQNFFKNMGMVAFESARREEANGILKIFGILNSRVRFY